MSVPSLTVVGRAAREVVPDRVGVAVAVRTAVLGTPQEALAACASARRRLLDHLATAWPGGAIADGRITTRAESRRVKTEEFGVQEERWETYGHTGHCVVTVEDGAEAAAAIVAAAGAHPDVDSVSPGFTVGPELERAVSVELEQEAVRDALERAAGLAAAAGLAVGAVLSIGEPGPPAHDRDGIVYGASASYDRSVRTLEEELGELRPEPEDREERVTVRVALVSLSPPS